ncbi:hypothetical protein DFH09DRAFT_1282089 [Mycena vulgaris]|nr:hypothetical protein DFH09DRAFT_1282089 [Mycena vulgaris]
MSGLLSAQEEAEALIQDIKKGNIHRDSLWPSIDYDHVSTPTCQTIFSLIDPKKSTRGNSQIIPETPRKQQISRQLDCLLAERAYLVKKRISEAQDLNARIKMRLEPIYTFLRAARRTEAEQFNFPYTDQQLLQSLATVRHALDAVEDMVRGNTDLDVTEPETELGDSDTTRVECKPDF